VAKAPTDLRSLARAQTAFGLRVLTNIARDSDSDSARVAAIALILDRGWGKAPVTHTGENGEGDIRVTIRHILEHGSSPQLKTIDQTKPLEASSSRQVNGNGK
jgi:hypothetical protein